MGHSTGFSSDDLLPRLITRERNVGQGCSAGKGWQNCSSNARALNKCFRHMVKVKKVNKGPKEEIFTSKHFSGFRRVQDEQICTRYSSYSLWQEGQPKPGSSSTAAV